MPSARLLALPLLLVAAGAWAQGYPRAPQVQPLQTMPRPTPDADALADAMRALGSNPRDLSALISAGELSLKLGDVNAAAALFKRAEDVDPMNGRVKAGMARILVSQERPGEALRYFDQAAGYGLDVRSFAGDRALAYDLIGEQERAQRDYRLALANGANDEVQRRYALSLGISGKMSEALAQIDPLLRESDRGAWRARAFILAMGGDVTGAGVIATRMMPPGMAAGLQPFFEKLATLPATDRAFAVHFGELRPTPQRLADRQLAPALPVLLPEAGAAPVALASAQPVKTPQAKPDRRRARENARDRRRRDREQPAAVAVVSTAATPPLPAAPAYGGGVAFAPRREVAQALPGSAAPTVAAPVAITGVPAVRPPVTTVVAANVARTAPAVPTVAPKAAVLTPRTTPLPTPGFSTSMAPMPATRAVTVAVMPSPTASNAVVASSPTASPPATTMSSASAPATVRPAEQLAAVSTPAPSPVTPALAAAVTASAPSTTEPGMASAAPTPPRMSEDTILARIIAGITIPASELGVEPLQPVAAPASAAAATPPGTTVATAATVAAAESSRRAAEAHRQRLAAAATDAPAPEEKPTLARTGRKAVADTASSTDKAAPSKTGRKPAGTTTADTDAPAGKVAPTKTGRRPAGPAIADASDADAPVAKAVARKAGGKTVKADDAPSLDAKTAAKKALADKKAADAKRLADAKKAEDKKKAADEAKAAKAEPARIWVQVAGGAYEGDLPKAWAAAKSKAPALAGKSAYSTPLRATNRVVTGPFKTDAEARAFVNTLAKQGISAFPFTSEKGQKMSKLPPK